jgi:flagellar basal-body rod protein FlgB
MHHGAMVAALSNPVTLAERRLSWLDGRQRVLAENVANADTPRYRARDVAPFARLLADAAGPDLARTNAAHIAPQGGSLRPRADRMAMERTPDGNGVSLDEQALRIAETDSQHSLAMSLHRKYLALFRTALGRNS